MQEKEQNISPIKQRILLFAASLGISKRDFYTKIGVSRGTLESKTGITEDVITKFFATYPEVNIEWLMTGRGEMLSDEPVAPVKQQPVISDERLVTQGVTPELITELLNRITEQAAEIGRLQEQIRQMRHRLEKDASDAPISGTANVG